MHKDISVAVPTRHRAAAISEFVNSFVDSLKQSPLHHPKCNDLSEFPNLNILHDAPDKESFEHVSYPYYEYFNEITLPEKSSLTELWNWCIMLAPTDWVLICNDDVTFNKGWLEYLEQQIATDKYDMIHLFHYGGMCLHKRLILKLGWFDENFRGGGFEDIDYQLRISEAGLKDRIDRSHDFIRKEGKVEIGHFMNHHRDVQANGSWSGENNADWMCDKWTRKSPYDYKIPSIRKFHEIDWHPTYTYKYRVKYEMIPEFKYCPPFKGPEVYL